MAGKSRKVNTGLITSTPALSREKIDFLDGESSPSEIAQDSFSPTKPKLKATYIKVTLDLVAEAVNALGINKKGVSFLAIQKYISAKEGTPEIIRPHLKLSLKKIILKSIENGNLIRQGRNPRLTGMQGSFMLPKKKPVKPSEKAEKKVKQPSKEAEKKLKNPPAPSKTKSVKEKDEAKPPKEPKKNKVDATKVPKQTAVKPKTKKELSTKETAAKTKKELNTKDTATKTKKELSTKVAATKTKKDVDTKEAATKTKKDVGTKEAATKTKKDLDTKEAATKIEKETVVEKEPIKVKKVKELVTKEPKQPKKKEVATFKHGEDDSSKENSEDEIEKDQESYEVATNKKPQRNFLIRKDLSDTEINVSTKHRQRFKSYSSDTEFETSRKVELKTKKVTKVKKAEEPKVVKKKNRKDDTNTISESVNDTNVDKKETTQRNQSKTRKAR